MRQSVGKKCECKNLKNRNPDGKTTKIISDRNYKMIYIGYHTDFDKIDQTFR